MATTWFVRADGGRLSREFEAREIVAMGYDPLDLSNCGSREDVAQRVLEGAVQRRDSKAISELSAFRLDMSRGDTVVTYDPEARRYLVGEILSDYRFLPGLASGVNQVRQVSWKGWALRDDLSQGTQNALSAQRTVYKIAPDAAKEVNRKLTLLQASA